MILPVTKIRVHFWIILIACCAWTAGCGDQPLSRVTDFSSAPSVTINLGEVDKEYGGGLQHMYHEKDGLTTLVTLGDVPCRHLEVQDLDVGYVYFVIDPSFKRRGAQDVHIIVEYFDQGTGSLGLQFDATGSKKVPNAAYAHAGTSVSLGDTKTWKNISFRVRHAAFKNSQNSGSDFRLVVQPPEIFIRKVTVTRAK